MDTPPESRIDPDVAETFRAELFRLWPESSDPEGPRLGIAVSGGPDSLALLLLANKALPGRVVAATIDHGLRAESADEAAMVANICEKLGIPHETAEVALKPGNMQDRARKARYEALHRCFGGQGVNTFATAHHADDQAETLLMRLNRGSGLSGLAGIRERTVMISRQPASEYLVVRPLLHMRRAQLEQIVADAGVNPARDPSNNDRRYDRVQVRQALAKMPWIDPVQMAHSARHLQEAERAVQDQVRNIRERCVYQDGGAVWYHDGHGRAVEIEVVRSILLGFGAEASRSSIATMVDRLRSNEPASLGGIVAKRAWHQFTPGQQAAAWYFRQEPPRRTG